MPASPEIRTTCCWLFVAPATPDTIRRRRPSRRSRRRSRRPPSCRHDRASVPASYRVEDALRGHRRGHRVQGPRMRLFLERAGSQKILNVVLVSEGVFSLRAEFAFVLFFGGFHRRMAMSVPSERVNFLLNRVHALSGRRGIGWPMSRSFCSQRAAWRSPLRPCGSVPLRFSSFSRSARSR